MSENRRQILDMLAQGKITAGEAERLLAALEKEPMGAATATIETRRNDRLKYLRVVVDAVDESGPTKVNIRIPMQLLRAGVRLTSLIPPQAREQVNEAMHKKGMQDTKDRTAQDLCAALDARVDEILAAANRPG